MRILTQIIRIFVGIIFIISGFVKLIDPMGFSFKMEEYFAKDVLNMPFFIPYALVIAIAVVVFELVLGVMLLVGYKKIFTILSLFILTVFFGFLTFYSAYFNKVTDCGCFGDAIKFTPWQSFLKDMVLLALVVVLLPNMKYIQPITKGKLPMYITSIALVACFGLTYYTLNHLPIIDFRAYKVGVNIQKGMEFPEDAPKPIFDYYWTFNVEGKEQTIVTQGAYPEVDGSFLRVETKEVSKGYVPPIHDFSIEKDGEDFTQALLNEPKLLMIISYDLQKANLEAFKTIKVLTDKALKNGYKVIGMTASVEEAIPIVQKYELNFDFYFTDQTTLKTMIRSNPAIIRLEKGTIMQKANYNDANKINL
ncbi:MAG: DoxX family protein [Capnocytophaga sp.]|nr:DoxX family protein [Capnocytophaga sp.]